MAITVHTKHHSGGASIRGSPHGRSQLILTLAVHRLEGFAVRSGQVTAKRGWEL